MQVSSLKPVSLQDLPRWQGKKHTGWWVRNVTCKYQRIIFIYRINEYSITRILNSFSISAGIKNKQRPLRNSPKICYHIETTSVIWGRRTYKNPSDQEGRGKVTVQINRRPLTMAIILVGMITHHISVTWVIPGVISQVIWGMHKTMLDPQSSLPG